MKFGVKNQPLLNIEIDHFIPDELHLMLRIMDVLLRNVINDAKSKDDYGKVHNQHTDNLSLLLKNIKSCGVTFNTWTSKTGELEWTSLTGNDMKKVMTHLPEKLLFCLHETTQPMVTNLWISFGNLYKDINTDKNFSKELVFAQAKQFLTEFLEIGKMNREGYHPKNITPYLHVLLYHVPHFLSKYGCLSKFSGQGVEKTNDIVKRIHLSKTNKLDPTTDSLLVRKRMETGYTSKKQREKRKYLKQDGSYWTGGILQVRRAKFLKINQEMKTENDKYFWNPNRHDYENMNVQALQSLLKSFGVSTRSKSKEKLIQLLRNTILSNAQ